MNKIKVGKFIRVKATGEILKVYRIDKHIYPVCAGYRRFKFDDIDII